MSHEGIKAFDFRSAGEIQRIEDGRLRRKANDQLLAEGAIQEFTVGERAWLDKEMAISERAGEIREKEIYEKLREKFG